MRPGPELLEVNNEQRQAAHCPHQDRKEWSRQPAPNPTRIGGRGSHLTPLRFRHMFLPGSQDPTGHLAWIESDPLPKLWCSDSLSARPGKQAEKTQNHQNGENNPSSTTNSHHDQEKRQTLPNRKTLRAGSISVGQSQPQRPQHDAHTEQTAASAPLLLGVQQAQDPPAE